MYICECSGIHGTPIKKQFLIRVPWVPEQSSQETFIDWSVPDADTLQSRNVISEMFRKTYDARPAQMNSSRREHPTSRAYITGGYISPPPT